MTYNYEDGASAGDARYVRLSSVEYPDGRNVFYIYPSSGIGDALSRVEAIAGDAAGATRFAEYAYLGAGTIVSVAHPAVTNGLTLDYNPSGNADGNPNDNYSGWDRFGRIVDQRWTDGAGTADLDHYTYTYDGNSNRTSRTNLVETNGVLDEDYTYDGLNRLVDTNRNGTDLQSWNLDSLGNWSSFTDEGTTEERTFNEANELLTSDTRVNPLYDAAGNMISGPRLDDPLVRQHYTYDAWNRLVEVKDNAGATVATFEYDGRNFRIGKTVGGVLEAFYYNEGQQLLETQVDGAATEEYVWDNRYIDAPILRATPGEVLYYANDANMNVTALIDASTGNVVERYHYDPYGEVLFMDADWTPRAASAFDNAVLYTGRRLDAETGLFYYRARYYDAQLGRFIGRDPIGYADGLNLYEYVSGRSTIATDPSGRVVYILYEPSRWRDTITVPNPDGTTRKSTEEAEARSQINEWNSAIDEVVAVAEKHNKTIKSYELNGVTLNSKDKFVAQINKLRMVLVEPLGVDATQNAILAQIKNTLANASADDEVMFEAHSRLGTAPLLIQVGRNPRSRQFQNQDKYRLISVGNLPGAIASAGEGDVNGKFILGSCQLNREQTQQLANKLGVPAASSSGTQHNVSSVGTAFDSHGAVEVNLQTPFELQEFQLQPMGKKGK